MGKKNDGNARAITNLSIEDNQIVHIRHKTTAKETWNGLKSVYERVNLSSKLFLLRKLYSTKLEESGDLIKHSLNILELVDKLKGN